MDLFQTEIISILPYDGLATYHGRILAFKESDYYFNCLLQEIAWEHEQVKIFDQLITTKRKVAWYGSQAYAYTYSNTTKRALPWTPGLLELKALVEQHSQATFDVCLLNLYHDGREGMGWHADDETELLPHGTIASLSLGAARKFAFKHKRTKENISLILESGSLLLMQGDTQKHWLHSLPKTTTVSHARINLTFRQMRG